MSLPNVQVTVKDGGLGALPAATSKACVTMGVCSNGVVNALYAFSDVGTLVANMGQGPGVESVAVKLSIAGGPQYFVPVNPSVAGSASAVTHTGGGAATVTVGIAPAVSINIACVVTGALATAQFQFTVNGGTPFTVLSAASWSSTGYLVPGTLTNLVFAAGSYLSTATQDTYTMVPTSTTVTHATGTGPAVTQTSSPMDSYTVLILDREDGRRSWHWRIHLLDRRRQHDVGDHRDSWFGHLRHPEYGCAADLGELGGSRRPVLVHDHRGELHQHRPDERLHGAFRQLDAVEPWAHCRYAVDLEHGGHDGIGRRHANSARLCQQPIRALGDRVPVDRV